MRSSLWLFSFPLFCSLIFAVPPLKLQDQQPLSTVKISCYSTSPRGVDLYYPSLDARLRRSLLTQRRRVEFAWRDTWEYLWPKIKPENIDVFLLCKQEDALFMTPQALFQSLYQHPPPELGARAKNRVQAEFFGSFEAEVVKMKLPTRRVPHMAVWLT